MRDLSVVIVNWNTRDILAQCLTSLQEESKGLSATQVETVAVDNASQDDSVALVKSQFPWARLVENTSNVGFSQANNQAIEASSGRYVMLLNSDTEVHPGLFASLVGFMDTHPEAGACGPMLINGDGSLQPSCHPVLTPWREFWRLTFLDWFFPLAHYPLRQWGTVESREVEVIKGACLVLRRIALDEVGFLDSSYFMYTEEMDLCFRLRQSGWKLYWVPEGRVTHYGEGSSRQVAEEMYVQLYRSKVQFHRKFGGDKRARYFKRLLTLAYVPRLLVTAVTQLVHAPHRRLNHTYRRLLAELPCM